MEVDDHRLADQAGHEHKGEVADETREFLSDRQVDSPHVFSRGLSKHCDQVGEGELDVVGSPAPSVAQLIGWIGGVHPEHRDGRAFKLREQCLSREFHTGCRWRLRADDEQGSPRPLTKLGIHLNQGSEMLRRASSSAVGSKGRAYTA